MSVSDPLIGRMLGDYRVMDMLGRGGMARVYRGYDPKLERYAAIKVIDAHLLSNQESEEEYRQRFRREARSIARLHHPNIVGIYQYGEVDALYYMAMVFLDGRDLGQILKEYAARGLRMPLPTVLRITSDMTSALDYAHAGGVIHRDVKPSNIMLTVDGTAVLTDFGLALSVPEGSLGNTFGSAHYIAPEQAVSSAQAVPQSDMYSLAVVIYQMLTGKVPFDDPSAMSVALKHISDAPPPLRNFVPELPLAIEQVMSKALEKDPKKRYPNGESFLRAMEDALMPVIQVMGGSRARPFDYGSRGSIKRLSTDEIEKLAMQPGTNSQVARQTWTERVASLPPRIEQQKRHKRRRRLMRFAATGLIVGLSAAAIWLSRESENRGGAIPTSLAMGGSATNVGIVDVTDDATSTQEQATSVSANPTEILPTETNTRPPTITPTEIGAGAAPTDTPQPPTFTPATSNEDAPVVLIYDTQVLTLFNRSDQAVDLTGLRFVRLNQLGSEIAFDANLWLNEDLASLSNLRAGGCLQVWLVSLNIQPTPDYCTARFGWRSAGTIRQFWISSEPNRTFEVRLGNRVLAICPTNGGECLIDLNPDD